MMTAAISHSIVFILLAMSTEYLCATDLIRACVFKSAARHRNTTARFTIADIDFTLCTHYIYSYAKLDVHHNTITTADPDAEEGALGLYKHFNSAKENNRYLRTLVSVGGPDLGSDVAFWALDGTEDSLLDFSYNALMFVRQHNFDGLDVNWKYPDTPVSKAKLIKLLQALRSAFGNETDAGDLLLTATCPGLASLVSEGFDVPEIAKYVDYVFVEAYGLVYKGMTYTAFSSPLFYKPGKILNADLNVNYSIHNWHNKGMPYSKMVLGVTGVGLAAKLLYPSRTDVGSPIISQEHKGDLYGIPSGLAYPEICPLMTFSKKYYDDVRKNPYLVDVDLWVGYEDERSIEAKIYFLKELHMAGVFFASLDEDDFSGKMCNAGKYPLLSHIKKTLLSNGTIAKQRTTTAAPSGDQHSYNYFIFVVLYCVGFALGCIFVVVIRRGKQARSQHRD